MCMCTFSLLYSTTNYYLTCICLALELYILVLIILRMQHTHLFTLFFLAYTHTHVVTYTPQRSCMQHTTYYTRRYVERINTNISFSCVFFLLAYFVHCLIFSFFSSLFFFYVSLQFQFFSSSVKPNICRKLFFTFSLILSKLYKLDYSASINSLSC